MEDARDMTLAAGAPDFEQLFHAAHDAMIVFAAADGALLLVNPAACSLYGYTVARLVGRTVFTLVADPDLGEQRLVQTLREGRLRFEARHVDANGAPLDVEISANLFEQGGSTCVLATIRDIRARKRAERALAESERRFRDMLGTVRLASVVLDTAGRVVFCNGHLLTLTGRDRDAVLGADWFDTFVSEDQRETARANLVANLRVGTVEAHERMDLIAADGERRVIAWSNTLLRDAEGRVVGTASIGEDITERERTEAALRENEERYALAALGANDGLWDWDLRIDRVYYSPRWKQMLGYLETEVADGSDEWFDRIHPEDATPVRNDLAAHLDGTAEHFISEFRMRHRDGAWRWMLARGIAVAHPGQSPHRMAGSLTDINDRKSVEHQLIHDALHDGLTGLPNRSLLLDRLERALVRAGRQDTRKFAVLFIDLDRFKLVNESLGHALGDALLIDVSNRLRRIVAPEDTVARLSGDEFCVLLESVNDLPSASRYAERVLARLARPFTLGGQDIRVTGSIGVVWPSAQHVTAEDVLRDADTATWRAKSGGRNRFVVFDASMHARAVEQIRLESGLRRAIEARELTVVYQPIVSLADGSVAGFEALARWPQASGRVVSPVEFIPVAEDTGLIVPLGRFVLETALAQVAEWRERFAAHRDLSVSVNLSVRQVEQDAIGTVVHACLVQANLPGEALTLELTESVLVNDPRIATTLSELRDLHVRTSIDDFGTGYSSLSVLHRLPFDAIKIDKSFIDGLQDGASDPADGAIVRAIVELAHGLGKKVVAEGVETRGQLERLRAMRCTHAQGYLMARPMSADEATRYLAGTTG